MPCMRFANSGWSKLTLFSWAPRKRLGLVCMDRNWLGFSVRIENDLVFVCGAKMTCFQCEDRLTWFWCGWSKLTFCVLAENNSVLGGHWNRFGFCVGGRNWHDVSVGDQNCVDFSKCIGIDLVLCGGRKILGYSVWIDIVFVSGDLKWFDFRMRMEIDLVSMLRPQFDWLRCVGSKLTWF